MKMDVGDDLKNFTLRVDHVAKELTRLRVPVTDDQVNVAIASGLSHEYVRDGGPAERDAGLRCCTLTEARHDGGA